jgi:aspartate racemase
MKKIGIVGGVGWPSTLEYYRLICSMANAHFKALGTEPPYPTPPMVIESLVMHETRKQRGKPGDEDEKWARFDATYRDALRRLQQAGCDFGIIASNTPHTRLRSIRNGLGLPIISILDETVHVARSLGVQSALVLGTDVIMRSDDYPAILRANNVEPNSRLPDNLIDELQRVIDVTLYQGATESGRRKILELCRAHITDADATAVLLACTELPLAFPEHSDDIHFRAEGFTFVNTTAVHARAALVKSLGLSR